MIFVNFKTYPQGTGEKAVKLAKICEKVALESGIEIIPVVQAVDLYRVTQAVLQSRIPVWVQHLDWQPQGQYTGWTNLESAIEAGALGTLLNHSEHQVPPGTVSQTIKRIRNPRILNTKFQILVCCKTTGQAERLIKFNPNYLAFEPSELIGNREKSVASEKPLVIKKIAGMTKIPVIVGAGIHSSEDVKISLQMGAKGILVSSDVVLAEDPEKELRELVEGFI